MEAYIQINTEAGRIVRSNFALTVRGFLIPEVANDQITTQKSFTKQQEQVEKFMEHKKACPHKIIISGDFNNTAFSWAYFKLKSDSSLKFILYPLGLSFFYCML